METRKQFKALRKKIYEAIDLQEQLKERYEDFTEEGKGELIESHEQLKAAKLNIDNCARYERIK